MSDFLITVVKTARETDKKSGGLSVVIVDVNSPGLEIRPLKKLGVRATGSNEIFFTDVMVPARNLMGQENCGWSQVVRTLNNERVALAAASLGVGQAAFEYAFNYALERKAFSKLAFDFCRQKNTPIWPSPRVSIPKHQIKAAG